METIKMCNETGDEVTHKTSDEVTGFIAHFYRFRLFLYHQIQPFKEIATGCRL